MATAGAYNFEIQQGATFAEVWKRSGVSSATGYHARIDIRDGASETALLVLTLSDANGRIALSSDGSSLVMALALDPTDTTALAPGLYAYDLHVTDPSGNVERLLAGNVTISAGVTGP